MNQSSDTLRIEQQQPIPKGNKGIKKETKCEKNIKKRQKMMACRVVSVGKTWQFQKNVINFGGYMIDLDYQMDDSLYTITERARAIKEVTDIQSMQFNKLNRSLQIFYSAKYPQKNNQICDQYQLNSVIDIIRSKNDQNLYYLSQLLEQYYDKVKEHFQKEKFHYDVNKKIINSQENLGKFNQSKAEFQAYINEFVTKQEQPFFTYSILAKNPLTFEYDPICYCFSEGLLSLLGTSLESAPDIFMRIGIVDFINRKSRFESLIVSMKTYIERKVQEPFLIYLRSYDFITIPALKKYERIQQDPNCPYELQAFIHTYEVEDYQLLQVIEKRKQSLHNITATINNLDDGDLIYTCQKEYFLEKYYNDKKNINL